MQISNKIIFFITLRTYFVRLFYTYKFLFGHGLSFSLIPYSAKIDKKHKGEFYKRHNSFFNTNDFLIGYAIGIILHFEEKAEFEKVVKVKSVLTSTLGAIGDKLVYKTVLPVFILLIMNIIVFDKFQINYYSITTIFLVLSIFFISNFSMRYFGIKNGYNKGIEAIKIFKSNKFKQFNKYFEYFKYLLLTLFILNLIVVFFI